MTYSEQFNAALLCKTKDQADAWLATEIQRAMREYGQTPEEAERAIKANLGYMAGYYDHQTAQKVVQLFGAVHPVFGTADYHRTVTLEEAFRKGQEFATRK